ncbi:type II toxin-antitoxin system VapC family toxin [Bosea sp. PAMC 26642]|uniref:type II toxin-antitoxin system VapC family toxin n=1 Tax=Bosea sp. (strain PAMC 26642) TaxID=1792307 RepID=UPI0007702666|nr:type II toxin-antitoxin system VapC family toxin [Bosea sp. PAMC 26642]AMJ60066.1 recombinase [Bosea sp. PAMC 26642]
MIFVDTNVVSETMRSEPDVRVSAWLKRHDAELSLSTIVLAEIAFGIERIRPEQRAHRFEQRLQALRRRFSGKLFTFNEEAALVYGEFMGRAVRQGIIVSMADGMIAAIALVNGGQLATRNFKDIRTTGLTLFNPWTD